VNTTSRPRGRTGWRVKSDHREEKLLDDAIDEVGLDEQMRSYFKRRYLEYLVWLEEGSGKNLVVYYALRIPAIILAALVPALVALDPGYRGRIITVVLGVVVAATKAGVERHIRCWHDLRHTALTHDAAAGNPAVYVQARAGHAQATMTERYVHAAQVAFPGAAERSEERLFSRVPD
jgi:integrase